MTAALAELGVGWLFIHPLELPAGARLWMLLPLVACVATVYRATRVRRASEMPKATVLTFVNVLAGMVLIAAGFYAVHGLARRFF